MTSLNLELGWPACSHLCQHPSCWPSFSPAPRNRGLQNPRLKRLLEAQTELSESDTSPVKQSTPEPTLPTLKILDIGESTAVEPLKRPSSPSIFPAVHSPRRTTRTVSHSRSSRSRSQPSIPLNYDMPPPTAVSSNRKSPLSRAEEKKTSPKHLPVRLNYVTVHDPTHPITSPPSNTKFTWVPNTQAAVNAPQPIPPLYISPLKNVTSQLIDRHFQDEGDIVSVYPKTAAPPPPQPAWDAWDETVFSLARAQLAACPLADVTDPDKTLLSSRSDISYLSNRDLFLSGRGLWRPIRSNKRNAPSSRINSRSLPSRHDRDVRPTVLVTQSHDTSPQLRQVSISLDSIPHIPKRIPVVLERFLSQHPHRRPSHSHPAVEKSKPSCELEDLYTNNEDNNLKVNNKNVIFSPSAPPPTPNSSQNLSGRPTLQIHLPPSPPLHQTEP